MAGLVFIISITFIFFFVSSQVYSPLAHEEYLYCLGADQNSYTPNNSSYMSVYFSAMQNLRKSPASIFKPWLIITPAQEYEIQTALRCAAKTNIPVRVCSGGHDYEGLSYTSTTPFVLIDLRNMSSISIDSEDKTAWVQSGAILGELYHKIAVTSETLAFVAGVCPTVGVGGHFSGGGYSMMSRKYGLAADNIIDARVMDANGEILDRESMGEDHFWAIRGGGGTSFGIVLSWKIRLLSVPEKVTVFRVKKTMEQNLTKLLYRWQHVASRIDVRLLIRVFVVTEMKTVCVSFNSLFLGGAEELLAVMRKRFPELGLREEDCKEMKWIESILFFAAPFLPGNPTVDDLLNRSPKPEYYFKGKSDYATRPIAENGWKAILDRLLGEGGEFLYQVQLSPHGGRMSQISESATPFPHRAGTRFMLYYLVSWRNETESSSRINWMTGLYRFMGSYVSESPRGAYFNYRDLDLGLGDAVNDDADMETARIWGTKYFKKNFDRLVYVKTKVDPQNFFRNEQSIPPMASTASSF